MNAAPPPKTERVSLDAVLDASEALVAEAGARLPTARAGAAALALALGRVAASQGLPLDALLAVARVAHAEGDLRAALRPVVLRWPEEEPS